MKLTPEQEKVLVEGLQQHDFTRNISLVLPDNDTESESSEKILMVASPLVKRVKEYMWSNLPDLGFKRHMGNFTIDQPLNFLMDVDAKYIAQEAETILSDEERTASAVEYYFELFGPLLKTAIPSYCKAKAKSPNDLDDADIKTIMDRVVTVVNEELISVLMQGQQFSAINDAALEMPTHEDFGKKFNADAVNFHDQWTHCKTAVGEMLSLDDEENPLEDSGYEMDEMFQIMCKAFCETLNDADLTLFCMREDGYTQAEIAEKLGYKSQSAVAKRLQKLRNRWDEFMDDSEPK